MVKLYFGLPGCGKTTLIAKLAYDECVRIKKGKSKYKHVYTNCLIHFDSDLDEHITIIENTDVGKYNLDYGLILIDEGSIFADNRDYKTFPKYQLSYFMLHRHHFNDIHIFSQSYNGVDKKIRTVCDRVYRVQKSLFWWRTVYYQIPYGLAIPKKGNDQATKYGDITEGYFCPTFMQRLFSPSFSRKKYYSFFDSFQRPALPDLPDRTDRNRKVG